MTLQSNAQTRRSVVPRSVRFSIRQLMLLILAVASGIALTGLEAFSPVDGVFAIASMLVAAGLWSDITNLRRLKQVEKHDRQIQICWRGLLLAVMFAYFVLVELAHARAELFGARALFEPAAVAPQMMLQLAFFSCLMLNARLPGKSSRLLVVGLFLALIVVMLMIHQYVPIVYLVQLAVEAMEISSSGNVQFGPSSQYASDSGGMLAGVDPNVKNRTTRFCIATGSGLIPLVLFVVSACWMIAKIRQRESYSRAFQITTGLAIASMIYPLWVYAHGLRQFSPSFSAAGIQVGLTSFVSALMALLVITFTLSYRAVAVEKDVADDTAPNWNATNNNATLFFLALANSAWLAGCVGEVVGGPLISIALQFVDYEGIAELLAWPGGYVAAVIVLLVLGRWMERLLSYWRGEAPAESRSIGSVELRSMSLVSAAILLMIVLAAPTIWWFVYALNALSMRGV